jgi:hypothetical protein
VIAALLDLIPNVGATIAGVLIGLVALSVSLGALIAVYQLIENYLLQPTIIGKRPGLGLHRPRQRPRVRRSSVSSGRSSACRSRPRSKIVAKELTAARRARVAAADAAEQQQPA